MTEVESKYPASVGATEGGVEDSAGLPAETFVARYGLSDSSLVVVLEELAAIMDTVHATVAEPELAKYRSWAEGQVLLLSEPYRLVVAGVQNSGKSTLVNVLLNEWLLPSRARNVDAVLTELAYAPVSAAEVVYSDGTMRSTSDEDILELIDQKFESDRGAEQARVDYCRLLRPNPNLRSLSIVNTPGLNDRPSVSARSEDFFDRADAIVWVFDAAKLEERTITDAVLKLCRQHGHKIIAVLNQIDLVRKAGGVVAEQAVVARFSELFKGCYETVIPLDSKSAAVGLRLHPAHARHSMSELQAMVSDSGYLDLVQHFEDTYFGHELERRKRDDASARFQATGAAILMTLDALMQAIEAQREALQPAMDAVERAVFRARARRAQIDVALEACARRHARTLTEVYLNAAEIAAEDEIAVKMLFQKREKAAARLQERIDEEVERRLPREQFAAAVGRDAEAILLANWLEFAEAMHSIDLEQGATGSPTVQAGGVRVDGVAGKVGAAVVKTAIGAAVKAGGERLVRGGIKRVIQLAVRKVLEQILKLFGKRLTVTLVATIAKFVNPALWLWAVFDLNSARAEVRLAFRKARADLVQEVGQQERVIADGIAKPLIAQNAAIFDSIAAGLNQRAPDGEIAALTARLEALETARRRVRAVLGATDDVEPPDSATVDRAVTALLDGGQDD